MSDTEAIEPGFLNRTALKSISWYQAFSSTRPPRCRFFPSCSSYAYEALETHGLVRGTWLSTKRICKCHPLGSHGYDPVPDRGI